MIQRFGLDIYDHPELTNVKTWEAEQDIKMLKLSDSTLYIKTLTNDWHILFENVMSFAVGLLLCVCFKDSTEIYSFKIESFHSSKLQMQKVAAGARHFIAFDAVGRVFGFGSNLHGQLGIHDIDASEWKVNQTLDGLKVIDVAAGDLFSLFLTKSGIVFSCGSDDFGQLGTSLSGFENINQNIPKPVFESSIGLNMQLAAGSRHSLILADNKVYGSGWSKYGQLGEKIAKLQGFKQIFPNFLVSKVHAMNWETILEIDVVSS